jgi:hypothetical protein
MITAYKVTRANATDFRTGTFRYEPGATLEEPNADTSSKAACGVGLHVSPSARLTCQYGDQGIDRGKWRWFEVSVHPSDVIGRDDTKLRVRKLTVVREVMKAEIFGADLAQRIEAMRAEAATWKDIRWLKPKRAVAQEEIQALLAQWHDAIASFHQRRSYYNHDTLPRVARMVTDLNTARQAAAAAADYYYAIWPYWVRWYVNPRYALWRYARWEMVMGGKPNPWKPIVEMFKLGLAPIGYARLPGIDETVAFTIWHPEVLA